MSDLRISQNGEPDLISASNGSLTVSLPIKLIRRGKCKAVTLPDGTTVQPRPWDDTPTPIQRNRSAPPDFHWLPCVVSRDNAGFEDDVLR
jgi:hypothetical protein